MYTILPITKDPRQIFTLDLFIDGISFHARMEIRYLLAPDTWVLSVWDDSSGELMINQIPLICSYGQVNDLPLPFRQLRSPPRSRHKQLANVAFLVKRPLFDFRHPPGDHDPWILHIVPESIFPDSGNP